jgi:hypothetical protein
VNPPPPALDAARNGTGRFALWLAVTATFLGSLLLFAFEPYVGKLLLPSFGGTPLLWNTCMVFFQVALLVGYLYALAVTRLASLPAQFALQLAILATLFVAYPGSGIHLAHVTDAPLTLLVGWLLSHALLPFLALAALTTLVQSWFARSSHPTAAHPYRLYAASNAGSMFGLFAYPLLFEPQLSLGAQRSMFLALLAVLVVAIAGFGVVLRREPAATMPSGGAAASDGARTVAWGRIIGLTAVPASLLLSVTSYILTDIASIPFFWTVPLAIYLATFIIAFGRPLYPLPNLLARLSSLVLLAVVVTLCAEANSPAIFLIPLHLLVFFLCCLFCHVRVTALQPPPHLLPQYYLAISVGGAVGGLVTLLVPPLLTDGLVEYPIALVLASIAIVPSSWRASSAIGRVLDIAVPAALVLIGTPLARRFLPDSVFGPALPYLPAAFYTLSGNERGTVFAMRLGALVAASLLLPSPLGHAIFAERTFFGRVRVTIDDSGEFHRVVHGSTVHGMQRVSGMSECHPVSYYHPEGPAGRYLSAIPESAPPMKVALIGLGSGALTCYARPRDQWDLFELSPTMARVASDPRLFTFVTNSKAARKDIILGDARLSLSEKPDARYDLIIIDAFSSDAIPLHLITKEAIQAYSDHLVPHGLLLFHISNRFFRLQPVLSSVGAPAGFDGYVFEDLLLSEKDEREGKSASTWMILARPAEGHALPATWKPVTEHLDRAWTDDYSNPLGALEWKATGGR